MVYNCFRFGISSQGGTIKTQDIFRIISEITEALSLTNEPRQLLDTALDATSRVLDLDCCWIQLVASSNDRLSLAAHHGFSPLIQGKMADMQVNHSFAREIAGIGNPVIIPDLGLDGVFDLPFFQQEGFRSLLAVPILTYRVDGILGTAYRVGKRFTKDYSDLLLAMAGMIGMAHSKCTLLRNTGSTEIPPLEAKQLPALNIEADDAKKPGALPDEAAESPQPREKGKTDRHDNGHQEHIQRMHVFRSAHRQSRG